MENFMERYHIKPKRFIITVEKVIFERDKIIIQNKNDCLRYIQLTNRLITMFQNKFI